jgi:hypothetical protein
MGHDVFLSYSTKDKTASEAVCAALERRGIAVWMAPRDIPPGSSYAASIVEAIDSARVLVLVFSAAANDSQDIEREVQRADAKRLKIVPFRIEDVEPKASLAYFLPSRQYLNAFTPPMEARYDELSEVVRRIAPSQPSPSPSGDVKPLPPPSPHRSQRFLPVLAGIVGLLVVSALIAWQWPRPTPPPPNGPKTDPAPVLPPGPTGQASGDHAAEVPSKAVLATSPLNRGFLIQFSTDNSKEDALHELQTAKNMQIKTATLYLYKQNDKSWVSAAKFNTQIEREGQLSAFMKNWHRVLSIDLISCSDPTKSAEPVLQDVVLVNCGS